MTPTIPRHLFSPISLGPMTLSHRVVMAPLTRSRSELPGDIPGDLMVEYYGQRASQGGLIISEATNIAIAGRGWFGAPGIYSDDQVVGWKRVTDTVHAAGGKMFLQLWHTGRAANIDTTNGATPVAPSVVPFETIVSTTGGWVKSSPHRALDIAEIPGVIEQYRNGAKRAMAAGFDGVELHGANGYLPDQFLQDGSNKRTDAYGGSIANRCRFLLEVVGAIASVWGGNRVAVRIAPNGKFNGMFDSNPNALYSHLAAELNQFGLAYLHVVEPRIKGSDLIGENLQPIAVGQLRGIFKGPIMAAGGFEPDTAEEILEKGDADLVAFGRHFLSNPDLPNRIRYGLPLNPYDRQTFYTRGARGYTDYAFYKEPAIA